jgi:hypothetical protein
MFSALVSVVVMPLRAVFGKHVNVKVLMRMLMVRVQMLVNLDLATDQAG